MGHNIADMGASPAKKRLRILFVDDCADDALLTQFELTRAGYEVVSDIVSDAAGLETALTVPAWDVILCDYMMPGFHPVEALTMAKRLAPDIPFLVCSGVLGEYRASQIVAAGARDFLVKGDPAHMVQAIVQAVADSEASRLANAEVKASAAERGETPSQVKRLHFRMEGLRMGLFDRCAEDPPATS
jgi:CheY-like chemotaxis protein